MTTFIVITAMLSLSDVACQTVHNINISDDVRQRRQAQPLMQQQISEIIECHNILHDLKGVATMLPYLLKKPYLHPRLF